MGLFFLTAFLFGFSIDSEFKRVKVKNMAESESEFPVTRESESDP